MAGIVHRVIHLGTTPPDIYNLVLFGLYPNPSGVPVVIDYITWHLAERNLLEGNTWHLWPRDFDWLLTERTFTWALDPRNLESGDTWHVWPRDFDWNLNER